MNRNKNYNLEYLERYYPEIQFPLFFNRKIPVLLIPSDLNLMRNWKIMRTDQILDIKNSKFEDYYENSFESSTPQFSLSPDSFDYSLYDIDKTPFTELSHDFNVSNHKDYENQQYYFEYRKLTKK